MILKYVFLKCDTAIIFFTVKFKHRASETVEDEKIKAGNI
jgi:hypothetical protein